MDSDSTFIVFILLLTLAVIVGLIFLVIHLVKKGQEESRQLDQQMMQLMYRIPPDKQMMFNMQLTNTKKNPTSALLLDVFLGGIGAHRFYMGETGMGILYLVFCWTYIPGLIAFVELFTITRKVNQYNLNKAREIASMLGAY